jgi:integrase
MKIEFLPTMFCRHIVDVPAAAESPKTWKVYAHTLKQFIRFIESRRELSWTAPTENDLARYRRYLVLRKLARKTIARAISIVCRFYSWAFARGYIRHLPFTVEVVKRRNRGMLRHVKPVIESRRPTLVPRTSPSRLHPRYFTRDEQECIFAHLSDRDRLILEWALYTGAREFEICALEIDQIPPPAAYAGRRSFTLPLRVTKFSVGGDLYVPTWLIVKTYRYIRFFGRAEISRAARQRGTSVPPNIFLSRWGADLKPNSVYKLFKKTLKQAGLRGTFHHLRHTYAISTLHLLMQTDRHKETEGLGALKELADFMRLQSFETAEKYLKARKFYLTEIYSDLYELPGNEHDA